MAYKQLSDEDALAKSGTTDAATGLKFPTLLSDKWAEDIYRALQRWLDIAMTDLAVLPIEDNDDAVGILPGVCEIDGTVLAYAGSAGAAVIDGIANNDTTLIWAYDDNGSIAFDSALESSGWPGTPHVKLAKVVMDAGAMTITDMRGASMLRSS